MAPSDDDAKGKSPDDGPKRPTPTIELEAETVEQDAAGSDDGQAAEGQAEDGETGEGETGEGEAGGGESGDGSKPAVEETAESKSGESRPRGRWSIAAFASHMAAGLVGGMIGVAAAVFGLNQLPIGMQISTAPVSGDGGGQLAAVRGDVAALKSGSEKSLGGLQERIAKAEAALAAQDESQGEGGDVGARLDKIESALADQGESQGEGGAAAMSAALKSEIDALKGDTQALKTQTDAFASEVEQMGNALKQEGAPGADKAALDAIGARLDGLEKSLGSLAERQRKAASDTKLAALAVSLASLRRAADSGAAYAQELDMVKSMIPANSAMARADLGALEAGAPTGVASAAALEHSFAQYARAALKAEAAPQSDALIDQLASRARSLVRVRPSAPVEGSGTGAVLARMEAHLKAGELAKAVAESEGLTGPPAKAVAAWRQDAKARLALDRGIQALERAMLQPLWDAAPAGNG